MNRRGCLFQRGRLAGLCLLLSGRWADTTSGASSTSLGAELGDRLLGEVCYLLSFLELLLGLAELAKLSAAISSASSICLLYVLIFC